ncbi:MAG: RagB/SusD family nutrient uptake outer membrane protein, partial [Candidatus Cryptobacteroides sp.]
MKKIYRTLVLFPAVAALLSGCNLDIAPTDSLTGSQMSESPSGLEDLVNGCYSLFIADAGENSWYLRQYFQFADFSSDDVTYGHETEDELNMIFRYGERNSGLGNVNSFWTQTYKIIYSANCAIAIGEQKAELSDDDKHLIGEAWFLKAYVLHSLARLYCEPYDPAIAANQKGLIIRENNLDVDMKARASLEKTYECILEYLSKAKEYFEDCESYRSENKGFASLAAVHAMYSRVYLYMEKWDECINSADDALDYDVELISQEDMPDYFKDTYDYDETIWCIKFTSTDDQKTGSIASMIYNSNGNGTWGEEGYSTTLLDDMGGYGSSVFKADVRSQFVQDPFTKNGLQLYGCTKFSGQNGSKTLNSPAMLRVSELYLNKAEAYAHKNEEIDALGMINEIRSNRFIPAEGKTIDDYLYTSTDVTAAGGILKLVLKERRVEFAFEATRFFDLRRNHLDIVRQYWGFHTNKYTPGSDISTPPA